MNNNKKCEFYLHKTNKVRIFAIAFLKQQYMVDVVQLVRASDCGSECRGFESHLPPHKKQAEIQ